MIFEAKLYMKIQNSICINMFPTKKTLDYLKFSNSKNRDYKIQDECLLKTYVLNINLFCL